MVSKLFFVLALALAAVHAEPVNRIVGGNVTTIDQYPSAVQVEFRSLILWTQSCAANILNNRYVLSAAHCFAGLLATPSNRRIRAGTTNRNSGGLVVGIERILNHPTYGRLDNDGDITLIRLSSFLTYSDVIQTVGIAPQGFEVPDGQAVVHAGWGAVSQGGSASSQLRHVQIYTINRQVCRARYAPRPRSSITDNMICAGVLDVGGRDACQGDSGGPLYYGDVLVGVVSWGRGCADAFYPGVSTAVSSYTNWIVENAV